MVFVILPTAILLQHHHERVYLAYIQAYFLAFHPSSILSGVHPAFYLAYILAFFLSARSGSAHCD